MGYYVPPQFKHDLAFKVKLCSSQSLLRVATFSAKKVRKSISCGS